ncbi:hypothetical protein ACFWD7_38015 [Streptomyces mirabilis]|uniref:hypothetical protein n=1 Tax=Streptomyces mirabilis TaxID=68239 RepID=UPI0021BE1804|nr:hypothetical protein [Streptomyces mirabilis]MCT9113809.1 hypothetical protein [Streptomyces mirabilis]
MTEFMRGMQTGEHGLDPGGAEDLVDEGGVLGIPVADQIADRGSGVLHVHDQILDRLGDPGGGRVGGGAEDSDEAGGVLDGGEDVLALPGAPDGLDEVRGQDGVGLGAQEGGPGGRGPIRGGVDGCPRP